MRQDVAFTSEGAELLGWFYTPDTRPSWPLVVMAHGFSATRSMTADKYAEVFCAAGLAVLLYDQPSFGVSGGEPRGQINSWIQARGYRDAIAYGASLESTDPSRVALWGDSMSAGVAVAVAAVDDRVAALSLQVPSVGSALPPPDPEGALFQALKEMILSGEVRPSEGEVLGPMPVVSDDQTKQASALEPLTAYRWFTEYGGRPGAAG